MSIGKLCEEALSRTFDESRRPIGKPIGVMGVLIEYYGRLGRKLCNILGFGKMKFLIYA